MEIVAMGFRRFFFLDWMVGWICVVVIGWVCECLGGSALGRVKDCPLLWVVGCGVVVGLGGGGTVVWGERIARVVGCGTGTVVLFGDFLNFFLMEAVLGV
jgi:hypothetical protein